MADGTMHDARWYDGHQHATCGVTVGVDRKLVHTGNGWFHLTLPATPTVASKYFIAGKENPSVVTSGHMNVRVRRT